MQRSKSTKPSLRFVILVNVMLTLLGGAVVLGAYWYFFWPHMPRERVVTGNVPSMWMSAPRYGYRHTPSARGQVTTYECQVTYTIDEHGCRITPDPESPKGYVLILGCSWTFGDGVEDDQNYPYLLGRDYWPEYKTVNAAAMGWGTPQAYWALKDALAEPPFPALVIYGWINHFTRNYRDKAWLDMLANSERKNPWFEVEDGALVFKGLAGPEDGLPEGPRLRSGEFRVTLKLIEEMDRMCRERDVPFYMVRLPENYVSTARRRRFFKRLGEKGINVIDIRDVVADDDYIPNDGHPNPTAHRKMAEALGTHPQLRAALY